MELTRKVSELDRLLQELLNNPPRVTQSRLAEFIRRQEALHLAQIDLDAIAAEITEMMLLGCRVEAGQHAARFAGGRLVVDFRDK